MMALFHIAEVERLESGHLRAFIPYKVLSSIPYKPPPGFMKALGLDGLDEPSGASLLAMRSSGAHF